MSTDYRVRSEVSEWGFGPSFDLLKIRGKNPCFFSFGGRQRYSPSYIL